MRPIFRTFANCWRQQYRQQQQHPYSVFVSRSSMSASTSAVLYAATVSLSAHGQAPEDAKDKKHHVKSGVGFDNPWASWQMKSAPQLMASMLGRIISGKANRPDTTPPTVTVRTPDFLPSRQAAEGEEPRQLRATWLGHACYYVEFPSGLRVLFDPVFSKCCGPQGKYGPKRYTPIPCEIEAIPTVDAVVISHSHYDHLDHPTIMKLYKKHPNIHFFAPLGNKKWFIESKIPASQITELDWWDEVDFTLTSQTGEKAISAPDSQAPSSSGAITARITALPCQHTSGRTPFDRAHTLWASWSVSSAPTSTSSSSSPTVPSSVYFAGDTGYRTVPHGLEMRDDHKPDTQPLHPHCPAFADIGRLKGPFDLGLIPIGAYEPRYIMSPMHADPFDAVEIFRDTRCRRALGMHWGTWVLTEEDVLEPPRILREALARRGLKDTGLFDVVEIGESRSYDSFQEADRSVDWEKPQEEKTEAKL